MGALATFAQLTLCCWVRLLFKFVQIDLCCFTVGDLSDNRGYDYYLSELVEDGHQRTLDETKVFEAFAYMRLQDISDLMPTFARSIPEATVTIVDPLIPSRYGHQPMGRRVNVLTHLLKNPVGVHDVDDRLRVINQILDAAPGFLNTLHHFYHCPLLQSMQCVVFPSGENPVFDLLSA